MLLTIFQNIIIIAISIYLLKTLISHLLTWLYFTNYDNKFPSNNFTPKISIIKPVFGVDEYALENFQSFCEQDYGNKYELLFCVETETDPAIPIIKRIIEEYPEKDIKLIYSNSYSKVKGKIKNIIAGFKASENDVIIFSDSDVFVPPNFFKKIVDPLKNKHVGLVFCTPVAEKARNWIAALLNVAVNDTVLHIAPRAFLNCLDSANGAAMATRREVIEEIGGLEQFDKQIADDVEISNTIYKKGYSIHLLKQPARIFHSHDTFLRWWSHMHRWLVIFKRYVPLIIYITFFIDYCPYFWGIILIILQIINNNTILSGIILLIVTILIRLLSTSMINIKIAKDRNPWRYLLAAVFLDILKLPILIQSLFTNKVVWRGRRIKIDFDRNTHYY